MRGRFPYIEELGRFPYSVRIGSSDMLRRFFILTLLLADQASADPGETIWQALLDSPPSVHQSKTRDKAVDALDKWLEQPNSEQFPECVAYYRRAVDHYALRGTVSARRSHPCHQDPPTHPYDKPEKPRPHFPTFHVAFPKYIVDNRPQTAVES